MFANFYFPSITQNISIKEINNGRNTSALHHVNYGGSCRGIKRKHTEPTKSVWISFKCKCSSCVVICQQIICCRTTRECHDGLSLNEDEQTEDDSAGKHDNTVRMLLKKRIIIHILHPLQDGSDKCN